jgi:hypothetical protein
MTTWVSRAQTVAKPTAAAHTVDTTKNYGRERTEPPDRVRSERNRLRRGRQAPETGHGTQTRTPSGPEVSG